MLPLLMSLVITFDQTASFKTLPVLERVVVLTKPFHFTVNHQPFTVPAGFTTDFASVPHFLQSIIANNDPDIELPAIIHDWLYQNRGNIFADDRSYLHFKRAECDAILRTAMKERVRCARHSQSHYFCRRWAAWSAVRVGGWVPWDKPVERQTRLQNFRAKYKHH
jgi:Protein of unknown function (DUF1353)